MDLVRLDRKKTLECGLFSGQDRPASGYKLGIIKKTLRDWAEKTEIDNISWIADFRGRSNSARTNHR
jgi:hypothetical protein